MIAIVDYGCGNLFSLSGSLKALGIENTVTGDVQTIKSADKIILPGVGAFGDAADKLRSTGLAELLKKEAANGKYVLGICLGMQLLFEKSYEYGEHEGLGLIKGEICPLDKDITGDLKIPHMGWNRLNIKRNDSFVKYISDGDYMYFVHSYYAKNCESSTIADAEYEVSVPAIVNSDTVYGTQFHPEKSGEKGLMLLKAFSELD